MTVPTRDEVSRLLWEAAEYRIIAEMICCEPLEEGHDLCASGYAALDMAKFMLVDEDPEVVWNPNAPVLDKVMELLERKEGER